MNRKLLHRPIMFLLGLAVMAFGFSAVDGEEATTQLEVIPFPGAKSADWFRALAHDKSGGTWVIANEKLYRLNGREFVETFPRMGPFRYLFGGGDRELYAAQGEDGHKNEGNLFRLDGEVAEKIGTYFSDRDEWQCPLYVSKSNTIIQYGDRFLAVRKSDGTWDRIGARLTRDFTYTQIYEVGETLFVYYDNSLYSIESTGEIRIRTCPQWAPIKPGESRAKGVLWAGTRALLLKPHTNELMAFDLNTGESYDLAASLKGHESLEFLDALSLRNGGVWILFRDVKYPLQRPYGILHISPDGKASIVPGFSEIAIDGSDLFSWPRKEVAIELKGGEILIGRAKEHLAIHRGGHFENWGWEKGIYQSIHYLKEAPDGSVWFPMERNLVRMRLGVGPPPLPDAAKHWEGIPLERTSGMWQLGPGLFGVFRKDRPDSFSRWDGRQWTHQKIPFATSGLSGAAAVDDRGHLLVIHDDGAFEIGPHEVRKFDNMDALLEQAVADGVRRFSGVKGFGGIVVTPEGEIWYGENRYGSMNIIKSYDGKEWKTINSADKYQSMQASSSYGVILKGPSGKIFRWDRGQAIELKPSLDDESQLMFNHRGFWHYDRKMVDQYPRDTFPVLKDSGQFFMFEDSAGFENATQRPATTQTHHRKILLNVERASSDDHVRRSLSSGGWIFGGTESLHPKRWFNGDIQTPSFDGTPLSKRRIVDVVEDGAGSLWFIQSSYSETTAFRYTLPVVKISTTTAHEKSGRNLKLDICLTTDRCKDRMAIFQRIDAGPWIPIDMKAEVCLFRFNQSGRFRCEIAAFEYGIPLSTALSFEVEVDVKRPESKLAENLSKPLTVDDIIWKPPVVIQRTTDEAEVDLLWAFDDGPWQEMEANGDIPLMDFEPGLHKLKFAAREEKYWQDETPLEFEIDYRPDYEKFVDLWLPMLLDKDHVLRDKAKTLFRKVGKDTLPILQKRLTEAQKTAAKTRTIERVLKEFGIPN